MKYVLQRTDGAPWYVTPPGSLRSYTPKLQSARTFETAEQARHEACGNERVLTLEQAMEGL